MAKIDKARFWTGVLYPENMREDWEITIGDIVQYPYAYCKHTKDKDTKSEHRKNHIHIILAFPNTTTYKHAMSVFDLLSAEGKKALNTIEACISVRNVYDYLIHDTETCRKQKKELYSKEDRITGNNFDIGAFEQLGAAEKNEMTKELFNIIREYSFTNFMDFCEFVVDNYEDSNYFEIIKTYSGLFEKMTKGNYQRWEQHQRGLRCDNYAPSQAHDHENTTETIKNTTETTKNTTEEVLKCCPNCGSIDLRKCGKSKAQSQIWRCKDCGKRFV